MLAAVSLDNEFGSKRNKIDDVRTYGRLSAEMKADVFQAAELCPKFDFLLREAFAKCARSFIWHNHPHPAGLQPATLPTGGEG
jgi:hypothetical protein